MDTFIHILLMPQTRSFPQKRPASTRVTNERWSVDKPKGSINLRIEAQTRQLIDAAAAILGKTRTEFMVESARQQAVDVLLDQRLFALDAEHYAAFMQALDHPPEPGPKLRALMQRRPAWQR